MVRKVWRQERRHSWFASILRERCEQYWVVVDKNPSHEVDLPEEELLDPGGDAVALGDGEFWGDADGDIYHHIR